jgi:superfamily II RNA helicase
MQEYYIQRERNKRHKRKGTGERITMQYKGFTLDKFQEDAIVAIDSNKSVVVSAPTGSGKTLIADYIINREVDKGTKVIYTAPIKALSNQKYKEFSTEYGEQNVGLLTGDIVKNPTAPIVIMTTEIYRNMVMTDDSDIQSVSYVIFDEIHYINDIERGTVWEESIIFSKPQTRMLCLSATIPNADEFAAWIEAIQNHDVAVIHQTKRNVPLHTRFYDTELGITTLKDIKNVADIPDYRHIRGRRRQRRPHLTPPNHMDLVREIKDDKVPCLFFVFSRKACQKKAKELAQKHFFRHDPSIATFIRKKLEQAPPEIGQLASTKLIRQTLPHGIGFHHAGLLPIIKEIVEELFGQGKIKVLYTTETFAVGINMPAKTVCFESMRKFDGINFRILNSKEFFQIAGRAGRRGIDTEGFVYVMLDRRDLDYRRMNDVTTADTEPIKSQFRLSVNTVLNLIKQHDQKEISEILTKSFFSFQKYGKNFSSQRNNRITGAFNSIKKKLEKMEYVYNNMLTEKGEFGSHIYADEILISEIFATEFYKQLDEYQILMVLAAICYEKRERTQFFKKFPSDKTKELKHIIRKHEYLGREKRFLEIDTLTALMDPCYRGKTIFDIIENTDLLEGDIIRFLRQILDRIGQIQKATRNRELGDIMATCTHFIKECMADVDMV